MLGAGGCPIDGKDLLSLYCRWDTPPPVAKAFSQEFTIEEASEILEMPVTGPSMDMTTNPSTI